MKIILLNKIEKLGDTGDIIDVKNGYAKNYLIPKKKALIANNKNIFLQKKNLHNRSINDKINSTTIKNFSNTSILIAAASKPNTELYTPINSIKLIKLLKKLDIKIQIKNIITNVNIKTIGTHKIELKNEINEIYNIYLNIVNK